MKDSWFFIDFGSSSPIYYWLKERLGDSQCDLRGHPWTLGPSPPGEGLPPVFEVGMRLKKVGKVHVRMRLIDWLRLKSLGCIYLIFSVTQNAFGFLLEKRILWAVIHARLGGGNWNICYFHPNLGEDDFQFDEHIFQDGLVQPPTSRDVLYILDTQRMVKLPTFE